MLGLDHQMWGHASMAVSSGCRCHTAGNGKYHKCEATAHEVETETHLDSLILGANHAVSSCSRASFYQPANQVQVKRRNVHLLGRNLVYTRSILSFFPPLGVVLLAESEWHGAVRQESSVRPTRWLHRVGTPR